MLVDWLHVAFVTHHAQVCTVSRSDARSIGQLVLELLRGLVNCRRPFRLRLFSSYRRKRIRRAMVSRRDARTLRRWRPLLADGARAISIRSRAHGNRRCACSTWMSMLVVGIHGVVCE